MVDPMRRIVRFSLDLDVEQKNFLKLFATNNGIQAAVVLRALIYLLETDEKLMNEVLDAIFIEPDDDE
jgi:hypothetical protein